MVVHSISNILDSFTQKNKYSLPFLESFIKEYSQKVTEDKKVPLFSHTSKYNNFPVRRQWKHEDRRSKQKIKPEWRATVKLEITKIKKQNNIKGNATRILNKITENNFEKQSNELLDFLIKNPEKDSVSIMAKLILEKICYDKAFYNLYLKLCYKLWTNNEWVRKCFNIYSIEKNGQLEYLFNIFFETKNNSSINKGPFKSEEKAKKMALKIVNFKCIFLGLCRDIFNDRFHYIEEYKNDTLSPNKSYLLKRKLFGSIEIVGYFYNKGYLQEHIIYYIVSTLCVDTKYEEEIESLKLLWDIIHKKLNSKSIEYYRNILKKKLNENWKPRIMFMIEDMIFEDEEASKNNNLIEDSVIHNFINLSRNNKKEDIFKIVNTTSTTVLNHLVSSLIKDSIEYEKYILNHLEIILDLLKRKISFTDLSNSVTLAGNDIGEIKIDAPNAPKNMSIMINKIISQTRNGNIRVHLTSETFDDWNNINKLIDISHGMSRFILE